MPVALLRVDERLIHGQVVVGWGGHIHPDQIVVVDDALAESPWEQELYVLGLPPGLEADFVSVEDARAQFERWRDDPRRYIVLLRDVGSLRKLAECGTLRGAEVNLGGVHHAAGRRHVLPYVFLSEGEWRELEEVADSGAEVSARDVPGAPRVPLGDMKKP